jgi:hypothetical protein
VLLAVQQLCPATSDLGCIKRCFAADNHARAEPQAAVNACVDMSSIQHTRQSFPYPM